MASVDVGDTPATVDPGYALNAASRRAAERFGFTPLVIRVPEGLQDRGLAIQRPSLPSLAQPMALDDGPASLVDSGPLYAGANVTRIAEILPAARVVSDLAP